MSDSIAYFRSDQGRVAVGLPFELTAVLEDWASLRLPMTRFMPDAFQRDEWAYLIQFLEKEHLAGVFSQAFGEQVLQESVEADDNDGTWRLLRPRGCVAVWLPNNVSLLGPLVTILLSLSGNRVLLKGGSTSEDLAGVFLAFAQEHLGQRPLRDHLESRISFEVFDREDPRNREFASQADVRILFGSDEAAAAVDAYPHPLGSASFAFVDRRSEAWIAPDRVDGRLLDTLIKVFGIYGQAGCTSPRRAVLLRGTPADALALRDALVERWPKVIRGAPAPHVASNNVMACQLAMALGWNACLTPQHAAMFAVGEGTLEFFDTAMGLAVVPLTLEQAVDQLPANIQTIGHAVSAADRGRWLEVLVSTNVKRFVPLARMHHFGPVWDGANFWRATFEEVEVET